MRKKHFLPRFLFLSLLAVLLSFSASAQKHHEHRHNHGGKPHPVNKELKEYLKTIPLDGDSLKGFDIKYVMERAAKRGVTKEELSRYIELRKKRYIQIKYGLDEETLFNQKANNPPPVPMAACTNMGFESGDISGWTLNSGFNSNSVTQAGCCPTSGGQSSITTGAATDGCGGFATVAPGGGSNSLMIGDGTGTGAYVNQLSQTFQTSSSNQILTVQYAVVLQDGGHTPVDQPYFNMQITDGSGNLLPCGEFDVIAGSGGQAGWQNSTGCSTTSYLTWQTVSFDLSSIPVGGNVTVSFTCGDCAQGGHFGYAYVDAFCGTTAIASLNPCSGGAQTMCAPAGMASYDWDGPPGSGINNVNSQCITSATVGNYSCTTTQAGGCPIPVMTYSLNNTPGAIAAFSSTPMPCSLSMNFTDQTNMNGSSVQSYHWDFGEAALTTDTSNLQNPTYLFSAAGTYTVTLSTTSPGGCVSTATASINVAAAPTAAFTAPADVCDGTPVVFVNNSTTPAGTTITNTDWDFTNDGIVDNTTSAPTFTYPGPGTYTAELTITNSGGCSNTVTVPIVVHANPVPSFATTSPCEGTATIFTDGSTIAAPSTISQWQWDFTNDGIIDNTTQSPSFTFPAAGTYTSGLTAVGEAPANCTATFTLQVTVSPQPVAAFTAPADICDLTAVNFTNTSTAGTGGTITSYAWDFTNDGATDNTTASPSFTYPSSGTYIAELTVISNGGCSSVVTNTIVVHPIPVPDFSAVSVCQGLATTFTNNSTIAAPGSVSLWEWDFTNDGTVDNTTQSPTFIFPAAGNFITELNVTGEAPSLCAASFTLQVTVHPNPVANFSMPAVCQGTGTQFTNLSSVAAPDNIFSNTWNFGDGNASALVSPVNTYSACGTYNAVLTVITNNGCNATFNSNVLVNCPPAAAFSSTSVCLNSPTLFTDNSVISNSTITQWSWDFNGDGTTDNLTQNPSNNYLSDGTFQVELIVTGANGCTDTITNPVTVFPNPQVAFTAVNACDGFATGFTNLTTINAPDNIATWAWDFDSNGSTESAIVSPTYIFPGGANTYNVTLTATSNNNCVANATVPVTVYPNPVASFVSTTVCLGNQTTFTDGSSVTGAGNTIAQWAWDFDISGTVEDITQNPSYPFSTFGVQNVELTVTTNNGCRDSVTIPVNVNPNPVANFSVTSVCFGLANSFSDLSSVNPFNASAITGWSWDFTNDGAADNVTANPTNIYASAGTVNASLVVTTNNGCTGTVTLPVTVYPLPVAAFGSDPNCVNAPVQFTDFSTVAAPSTISAWNWDLTGDGITDSGVQNPSQSYVAAGALNITLIVTTNNGCMDTVTGPSAVNPLPVVAFSGDDLSGCPVHCVNFTDASVIASGNIVQWTWDFGDATTASTQNANHCFDNTDPLNSALFTVSLSVVSDSGCAGSLVKTNYITVFPEPVASFSYGPTSPEPNVANPIVDFFDLSVGADSWSWDFGDVFNPAGSVSTLQNPSYNYNHMEAYLYNVQLAVANTYGCVDTIVQPIYIEPEFTFYCPNAFTPNEDFINDGFRGYGIGIRTYKMWIYDRWGNMIFTADELTKTWDGKVQGKSDNLVQIDTYVWKVKLTDVFGRKHDYIGHVSVVR
jgi:gliding motility-associated-like protein